jgi:hypothetical protein
MGGIVTDCQGRLFTSTSASAHYVASACTYGIYTLLICPTADVKLTTRRILLEITSVHFCDLKTAFNFAVAHQYDIR